MYFLTEGFKEWYVFVGGGGGLGFLGEEKSVFFGEIWGDFETVNSSVLLGVLCEYVGEVFFCVVFFVIDMVVDKFRVFDEVVGGYYIEVVCFVESFVEDAGA